MIRALGLAGLGLALMASAATAQISDDVVKIGVLTDMVGPASAPTGQGSVTAAQMAVEDFGGTVLGKPIVVISSDYQLKPDIGAGVARRAALAPHLDVDRLRPRATRPRLPRVRALPLAGGRDRIADAHGSRTLHRVAHAEYRLPVAHPQAR